MAVLGRASRAARENHLREVAVLAAVLALSTTDSATLGAVAVPLARDLDVTNVQIALLVTVSSLVAAAATLPAGALVDRVDRVRLLTAVVALWAVAMTAVALAGSWTTLLLTRLALGLVVGAGYPAVPSLVGSLVPPQRRTRVYGWVLTGEFVGVGVGYLGSGTLAATWSWRTPFLVLAGASVLLALAVRATLVEPRGATGHGSEHHESAQHGGEVSLRAAVRQVLRVPTNVLLVLASGLGYFFFSGARTFAPEMLTARGFGQGGIGLVVAGVGVGAVAGVVISGRLADRLHRRGLGGARPVVAGVAFPVTVAALAPGLLTGTGAVAVVLLVVGAAAYGGTNPPLDAARLDVVPAGLWGRAEAVRTVLRTAFEAGAPLAFALTSRRLGASVAATATSGDAVGSPADGLALARTFALMLAPLLVSGALLLGPARRSYPRDAAAARSSSPAAAG